MQIGFSLPRVAGLLVGGVGGCMLALAVWYVMTAVMLHQPFTHVLWHRPTLRLRTLFVQSLPLCVFSSLWSLYLLSNRWVCWSVSSASDAGLFGFGADTWSSGSASLRSWRKVTLSPSSYDHGQSRSVS